MPSPKPIPDAALAQEVLKAFDDLSGLHPGFRPAHAKGMLIAGSFTPAAGVNMLTVAPHVQRASTPVTLRFSDATGIPNIPDNDSNASPRGCAVRFHLAEHSHTDIIAHSTNGFPVRTVEEFTALLRAVHASGPGTPSPTPIENFLGSHPAALDFAQTPKPFPASFASETFYGVNAYRFTNKDGVERYGRYRIRPDGPSEYLDAAASAKQDPNYLFDDIRARLNEGPVRMLISVQLASKDDVVDDSTVRWPQDRTIVEFGVIELTAAIPSNDAEQQHIIFDPIPRVQGLDPSGDPLLEARASIYLASGRRRRSATQA